MKFEQILEVWRKMEVGFGEDGTPIWPTMFLPPEAKPELAAKLPKWLDDPECQRKFILGLDAHAQLVGLAEALSERCWQPLERWPK